MENTQFDLVIIGGGPAGYVGAIRASQLGMKVACIEKRERLGGTCLNVGCIPSKALLDGTEAFQQVKHSFPGFGIQAKEVSCDLTTLMSHKLNVVKGLADGIDYLFKKNKITRYSGTGILKNKQSDKWQIEVSSGTKVESLSATKVLLAMGSEAIELPFLKFDGVRILSSTEALGIPKVPEHLIVVGGGYIGLELASVWSRLGSKITILEFGDRLLPSSDEISAKELQKCLTKQGFDFRFRSKCTGARVVGEKVIVEIEKEGSRESLEGDRVLVAVGRRPLTEGEDLAKLGINLDERKRIIVDKNFRTNIDGVYAVGDLIAGPMLAHKASEEAVAAVEIMNGVSGHVNYETIPSVMYTWPEYASVGAAEHDLKAKGTEYKVGSFPFSANARARSLRETEGLARVLTDAKTDRVLGVHIVGPRASEIIPAAVSLMEFGGSSEDLARTCFAHPTLPEVLKEAALDVDERRLHL